MSRRAMSSRTPDSSEGGRREFDESLSDGSSSSGSPIKHTVSTTTSPARPTTTTSPNQLHNHKHPQKPSNNHDHDSEHDHDHDHSHSIFHNHVHDHSEGAEQLITAISSGRLDRGTKITLLGLFSNVLLTVGKGGAALVLNSASLLAEAGHSLSDLLGDFVTLATWRLSRKPPSLRFPWGYSKFETIGTLSVSLILVGGSIGIFLHSYHLLLQTLIPFLESLPPSSSLHDVVQYLPQSVPSPLLELFHSHSTSALPHEHGDAAAGLADDHSHGDGAILNPHAAWFALASVVIKEWLYRLTNRVAKEEHSPVLRANALHHRADALTSGVALASILGSSFGGWTFLDPIGGIAVSLVILQQGVSLSRVAMLELLDAGVDQATQRKIEKIVELEVDGNELLGVRNVRGVRSGGQTHLDLTISVPPDMTVRDSHAIEERVRSAIMSRRRDVKEVKIHVHGEEEAEREARLAGKPLEGSRSDFGGGC